MPGCTTVSWRSGSAASQPGAGSHIPSGNCSTLPGDMMPERIISAVEMLADDRRAARIGVLGNCRLAGVPDVVADAEALDAEALAAASGRCRSRQGIDLHGRQRLAQWFRSDLGENAFQRPNAGREREAITIYYAVQLAE
jgi:hypothetical protein